MSYKINFDDPRSCPNCGSPTNKDFTGMWFDDDDLMLDYFCHKCCCTFSYRYRFDQVEVSNDN